MKIKIREIKWHVWLIIIFIILFAGVSILRAGRAFFVQNMSSTFFSGDVTDNADSLFKEYGFFGKSYYQRIDERFTYHLTGQFSSSQVVLGDDDWLFYKGENSIQDYEGTNEYTEEEIEEMLASVETTQTIFSGMGIRFAMVIPPNKERVYFEKIPKSYSHCERSRTDILVDRISEKGLHIVDIRDALFSQKKDFQLYYKNDSHWNQLGAYVAVRQVLQFFGTDLPSLHETDIRVAPLKNGYHYGGSGDLACMINMLDAFDDEPEYSINQTANIDWNQFTAEAAQGRYSIFTNPNAPQDSTLLLLGDSFRASMIPALSAQFKKVYVVHYDGYQIEMLEAFRPDYVVFECVERYSNVVNGMDERIFGK